MSENAEVWLVRHARTEANAAGIWQGRTDGDVDSVGESQIVALASRFAGRRFDLVLTSPLQRARKTAAVFGDPIIEEDLVEVDLGRWDGLTTTQLVNGHPSELEAFRRGDDVQLGRSGESPRQVAIRIESIIDRIFDRLWPGEKAVVVTHGGVLDAVTHRVFGRAESGRRLGGFTENTGITRLARRFGRSRLASFNDTGHLGARPASVTAALARGRAGLTLVRHGQTRANVEGRWQGQSDWGLDEVGQRQARALAEWYGPPDRVISSPLGRALETARALGPQPEVMEGLVELGFGEWEGLTLEEVRAGHSALFRRIFVYGHDLPRGVTGESWAQLTARITSAIASIEPEPGRLTAVVTHGAAIRSYLAHLAGGGWSAAGSWETPANASVTHLVVGDRDPLIVDYSSAIHVESPQPGTPGDPDGRPGKDEG